MKPSFFAPKLGIDANREVSMFSGGFATALDGDGHNDSLCQKRP